MLIFVSENSQLIWAFGYWFQWTNYTGTYGWFIVIPYGEYGYSSGPMFLIMWALYMPVAITLYSFQRIVKKRQHSRIARFFHWYYFLVAAILSLIPLTSYYTRLALPLGFIPWFLMYLRYKQLNCYLEQHLKSWKADTVAPVTPIDIAPATAPAVATESSIKVASGYDIAGENLKLGVKVNNESSLAIMNVTVNLDVPDGFEFVSGTLPSQKVGNISAGSFQSAIFWLKPIRCVDDEYGGSVIFRDAQNNTHTIPIPRKRIINVCPMLENTDDVQGVFKKLKFGSLARNCASFKFTGNTKTVFELAKSRLRGLDPVDSSEQVFEDGNFLGYSCYIGQTKFGDQQFAAEIQTIGTDTAGVLTLSVYSDDERIFSGYMIDVMKDVREHVEVIEEQACPLATCLKCGAGIDPTKVDDNRVYICSNCGGASKVAPWLV